MAAGRSISITTPLGSDVLLLTGFSGREAISELFDFQLDLVAANSAQIPFEPFLGQPATVSLTLPTGGQRFFSGIVSRFSQGARGPKVTSYRAEVVPSFWLSTRRQTSRIFQQLSVPDILQQVLAGIPTRVPARRDLRAARLLRPVPRDRLRLRQPADGGGGDLLLLRALEQRPSRWSWPNRRAATRTSPARARSSSTRTGAGRPTATVVFQWEKAQELRSGKYTLWDHCFELPHEHLEAARDDPVDSVAGRRGHPPPEARRQRRPRDLRLPRRLRPAVRRRTPAAATGRPTCRICRRTADGRHPDAGGGAPSIQVGGAGDRAAADAGATRSRWSGTSTATADYVLTSVEHAAQLGQRLPVGRPVRTSPTRTGSPASRSRCPSGRPGGRRSRSSRGRRRPSSSARRARRSSPTSTAG